MYGIIFWGITSKKSGLQIYTFKEALKNLQRKEESAMKEEIFLIVLGNLICPLLVYIITEILKNHSSKFGDSESGNNSSSEKKNK